MVCHNSFRQDKLLHQGCLMWVVLSIFYPCLSGTNWFTTTHKILLKKLGSSCSLTRSLQLVECWVCIVRMSPNSKQDPTLRFCMQHVKTSQFLNLGRRPSAAPAILNHARRVIAGPVTRKITNFPSPVRRRLRRRWRTATGPRAGRPSRPTSRYAAFA